MNVSVLQAVGEVSPDTEYRDLDQHDREKVSIRKQDSYIEAIRYMG